MSVEELARRTGTTVSNLRALQARGLLAPPRLAGRKGIYGPRHEARVALLRRLQDRGYSLSAIADLLRGWERGAGLREVLELEDAVSTPIEMPRDAAGSQEDVHRLLPELLADHRLLARGIELELVAWHDGRLVAPSVELLEIGRAHADAGIPLTSLLEELARLRDDAERIAQRFRALFQKHVFGPQLAAGKAARLPALSESVARLRPASVRAATIAIARAIERGGVVPASVDAPPVSGTTKPRRARKGMKQ